MISDGQVRTQALVAMVGLVLQRGGKPTEVLIHPEDYAALRDGAEQPVTAREVLGVPIVLDPECPRGCAQAVA